MSVGWLYWCLNEQVMFLEPLKTIHLKKYKKMAHLWTCMFVAASFLFELGTTEPLTPPTMDFDSDLPSMIFRSLDSEWIQLKCAAYGNPQPKIHWYHDGEILPNEFPYLTIEPTMDNRGRYQCFANNSEGSVFGNNYTLSFGIEPPVLLGDQVSYNHKPRMIEHRYNTGKDLFLECYLPDSYHVVWETVLTTNNPPSDVVYDDGTEATRYYRSLENKEKLNWDAGRLVKWGSHILVAYAEPRDQGVYACKGIQGAHVRVYALHMLSHSQSGSASPITPDSVYGKKPTLLPGYYSESTIEIRKGERLRLDCVFSGYPTPSVLWQKDSKPFGASDSRITESGRRFLVEESELSESGEYTCTGRNRVNSSSHTMTVVVQSSPWKNESILFLNQTSPIGANATFVCISSAIPQPKVTWSLNGITISKRLAKWTFLEGDTVLHLRNFQISERGTIVCKVENTLGSFRHSAYLTIATDPQEPCVYNRTVWSEVTIDGFEVRTVPESSTRVPNANPIVEEQAGPTGGSRSYTLGIMFLVWYGLLGLRWCLCS